MARRSRARDFSPEATRAGFLHRCVESEGGVSDPRPDYAGWLIKKGQYYYRPNWSGYTGTTLDAGRYTREQADREALIEPENFTVELAPEMVADGIGSEISRILRSGM